MKFHKWVKPEVISLYTTLLAAGRNGYSKGELDCQAQYLKDNFGTKVLFIDMPELVISSNAIRSFCKKNQYNEIQELLPEAVYEYIKEHELWKCPMN